MVSDVTAAPSAADSGPLFEVRGLTVYHGQLRAVSDVSLEVRAGEVHAIIGANGAGKSTLLRTLAGLHRAAHGTVRLDGRGRHGRASPAAARRGDRAGAGRPPALSRRSRWKKTCMIGSYRARPGPWNVQRVYELFQWMWDRRRQRTAQMSGGEQQAVAIGRALVTNPRVLLLDELSLGLAPVVVRQIYALLPELLRSGMTVLLVEQDVSQAVRVASSIQCLLEGRTTLEGRPSEFTPEQIEAAYFGLAGVGG